MEMPGLLQDGNGQLFRAADFGLVAGEKLRAEYVRDHPEYPWPAWLLAQVDERMYEQKRSQERAEMYTRLLPGSDDYEWVKKDQD